MTPRPPAPPGKGALAANALGTGVPYAKDVHTMDDFDRELAAAMTERGCRFINVRTNTGHSRVAPRQRDGMEDKYRFVRHVEQTEGIQIMTRQVQDRKLMAPKER